MSVLPSGVLAGTQQEPEIVDQAGDANYINHQSLGDPVVPESGPDARPASIDSADVTSVWYETAYQEVVERDAAGSALAVRRIPTALLVHIETTAASAPSFGPTLKFDVWARVGECPVIFRHYVHGPRSQPNDPAQGAQLLTRSGDCLEGAEIYAATEITQAFSGNVVTLTYPFSTFTVESGGQSDAVIGPGFLIGPDPGFGVQVGSVHGREDGPPYGGPMIDLGPETREFEIGSDVPPDVDCASTPDDPACSV